MNMWLLMCMTTALAFPAPQETIDSGLSGLSEHAARAQRRERLAEYALALSSAETALGAGRLERARRLLDECAPGLRGWEWQQLHERLSPTALELDHRDEGDEAVVMTVAFSPDGCFLAVVVDRGEVRLWRTAGWERANSLDLRGERECTDLAFGPEAPWEPGGQWFALATGRGELYEAATLKRLALLEPERPDDVVLSVACSERARLVALAGEGFVELWDVGAPRRPERVQRFDVPDDPEGVGRVGFDDNGAYVYAWPFTDEFGLHPLDRDAVDASIRIWDVDNGALVARLSARNHPTRAAAAATLFDPGDEGYPLLLGTEDHGVRVVDAGHGDVVSRFGGHGAAVSAAAVETDEEFAATGTEHGEVIVWNLYREERVASFHDGRSTILSLDWNPTGELLAVGGLEGVVRIHDVFGARPAGPVPLHGVSDGSASSTGRLLVGTGRAGTAAWDMDELVLRARMSGSGPGLACSSSDGTRVVAATGGMLQAWDTESGELLGRQALQGRNGVTALVHSPSECLVAVGTGGGQIALWDADLSQHYGWRARAAPITQLAFDSEGRYLVSASDGVIDVWDARRWDPQPVEQSLSYLVHDGVVLALALDGADRFIATGTEDGHLQLWDRANERWMGEPLACDGAVTAVVFSPDGRRLLVGVRERGLLVVDPFELMVLAEVPGSQPYLDVQRLAWPADDVVVAWARVVEDDVQRSLVDVWGSRARDPPPPWPSVALPEVSGVTQLVRVVASPAPSRSELFAALGRLSDARASNPEHRGELARLMALANYRLGRHVAAWSNLDLGRLDIFHGRRSPDGLDDPVVLRLGALLLRAHGEDALAHDWRDVALRTPASPDDPARAFVIEEFERVFSR